MKTRTPIEELIKWIESGKADGATPMLNIIAKAKELQRRETEVKNLVKPDVIGSAFVRGQWKDVELIDESRIETEKVIRVIWRDEQNRRVTSFVSPSEVKKHCL